MTSTDIPGYGFGSAEAAQSPLSMEDLLHVEQALGWTSEDEQRLRNHAELFRSQAEQMIESWRAVIARQPHLSQWFAGPDGKPDEEYKAGVKRRFVQWVVDVATRSHDQAWLNYQEEIGLRHTPAKKNKTDHRHTPPVVPQRYLLGFSAIVITSVGQFLSNGTLSRDDIDRTQQAWTRAVLLCITLWSRAYATDGLW